MECESLCKMFVPLVRPVIRKVQCCQVGDTQRVAVQEIALRKRLFPSEASYFGQLHL